MDTRAQDPRVLGGIGAVAVVFVTGAVVLSLHTGPQHTAHETARACARVSQILAREAVYAQDPLRAQRDATQRAVDQADLRELTAEFDC